MVSIANFVDTIFKFLPLAQFNAIAPVASPGQSLPMQVDANGRLRTIDESIGVESVWTPPVASAATGTLLEGQKRVAAVKLTNAGGSGRWVWLYDGANELIDAIYVATGATETQLLGAGIGFVTQANLNFKTSSSADVFTADGSAKIRAQALYYVDPSLDGAPTLVAASPSTFPLAGGSLILTGTGYILGATVKINDAVITPSNVVSSSEITLTAPPLGAGSYSVEIINPDGTHIKKLGFISYAAAGTPTVSSTTPNPLSAGVGGTAHVIGTGFVTGCTVKVNGFIVTSSVNSSTDITITAPALSAGSYSVQVINPDLSDSGVVANKITYAALFDPLSTGPTQWLRADAYTAGTGAWVDASGNGHDGSVPFGSAPTDGATVNGHKAIHFNGSVMQIAPNDSLVGKNQQTYAFLIRSAAISTDDSTAFYGREVVLAIVSGGGPYITLSSSGNVDASVFDGSFEREHTAYATSAWTWIFVRVQTVSGTTKIQARTNKGSWSAGTVVTLPLTTVSGIFFLGHSGSSVSLSNSDILESLTWNVALSDANCNNIVDYGNSRYAQSLS